MANFHIRPELGAPPVTPIRDGVPAAVRTALEAALRQATAPGFVRGPRDALFQFDQFAALALRQGLKLRGKTCVDFGCGALRPFNIATLLYLAGADRVTSIDMEDQNDPGGSAIGALSTLLAVAFGQYGDFGANIEAFCPDLPARLGDFSWSRLLGGDASGLPPGLRRRVGDFRQLTGRERQFDVLVSNSVFEHVAEIGDCLSVFREAIAPDGAIYASIDYRDHRLYAQGASMWQFMIDGSDHQPGYINKIRHPEMAGLIQGAGFTIAQADIVRQSPSPAEREAFRAEYRNLSDEEIDITEARVLLVPA